MDNPHTKYIKIDGVRKINPEYTNWENVNNKKTIPQMNNANALAVVTNMNDFTQLNNDLRNNYVSHTEIRLADATDATIDIMQEKDFCDKVGLKPDVLLDDLGKIFAKYEIPIGLMNKLTELSTENFDEMEIIVDDSGSMGANTDTFDKAQNKYMTRWDEVRHRLGSMIEILAYIPCPPIRIVFLNRSDTICISHNGAKPLIFINDATIKLDKVWKSGPSGTTPFYEKIKQSFDHAKNKRIIRYFFGDGEPNGGVNAQQKIKQLVVNRSSPQSNPITFLSCTDNDQQTEWMKEIDELASWCAEIDDYEDERDECRADQGIAFPYTYGIHLIRHLVDAINPDDLDCLDESIPMTKYTLDNMLGVVSSPADYEYYFNEFINAQKAKNATTPLAKFQKTYNWRNNYNAFTTTPQSKTIQEVIEYKKQLARY